MKEKEIVIKDHYVNSYDGNAIYIKEKVRSPYPEEPKAVICLAPCIYSHEFYDCPISDYSLMNFLASNGYDVFAFDTRGFGKSHKPMDGKSVNYEVELKDAHAVVEFVRKEKGFSKVSLVGFGSGAEVASGYSVQYPQVIGKIVLMDFMWEVYDEALNESLKEFLESQPNGYLQLSLVTEMFDELLRYASPEVLSWIRSTFQVAPVGPLLAAFIPPPLAKPAENITASVLIIRGSDARITSQDDSFNFLNKISGELRAYNDIRGAGPVPSLEKDAYKIVFKNILWFLRD